MDPAANPLIAKYHSAFLPPAPRSLKYYSTPPKPPAPLIPSQVRKEWRKDQMEALGNQHESIAKSILVTKATKPHLYLSSPAHISRPDRATLSRWQLGLVCNHKACRGCPMSLSRNHARECCWKPGRLQERMDSNMDPLNTLFRKHFPFHERFGLTPIDHLLNASAYKLHPDVVKALVTAISDIELHCLRRDRSESGFFASHIPPITDPSTAPDTGIG